MQVREVYRLLVDSSTHIRHAAAELVAGMLEEQGKRFLAQVCTSLHHPVAWQSSLSQQHTLHVSEASSHCLLGGRGRYFQ